MKKIRICGDRDHPLIRAINALDEKDKATLKCGVELILFDGYDLFCMESPKDIVKLSGAPDDRLEPCPFCGGRATLFILREKILDREMDCHMAQCAEKDCGCGTSYEPTPEKVIASWNRRTEVQK